MYLMMTDETNFQPSTRSRFFIYGGLVIPLDRLSILDREIDLIRKEAGYEPTE